MGVSKKYISRCRVKNVTIWLEIKMIKNWHILKYKYLGNHKKY